MPTKPPDKDDAIVAVGSPYRGAAAPAEPIAIARKRGFGVADAVLVTLVLAVVALYLLGRWPFAIVLGVGTGMFAAIRLADRVGLRGVHRLDADERGIRLRCTNAALAQALAVPDLRPVDLFIPWKECLVIDARPHRFGDDMEVALVIRTPNGVVAVRRGAFADKPERIAETLRAARQQLALPPQ